MKALGLTKLLCLGVASTAIGAPVSTEKTATKPNVLFISLDDLKPTLGCYGDKLAKTPNIDKLAEKGIVFTNNYCQQAVCGPSRTSLLTGYCPDATQVWDLKAKFRDMKPNVVTLPQLFRENGYTTVSMGKIYDGRNTDKFRDKASWTEKIRTNIDKKIYQHTPASKEMRAKRQKLAKEIRKAGGKNRQIMKAWGKAGLRPATESCDIPDNAYLDGVVAEDAVAKMKQLAEQKKPFFLGVGFIRPHLPFYAPKKYWDMYKRSDFKINPWQKFSKDGPKLAYHGSGELRSFTGIPKFKGFENLGTNDIPEEKQKELIHGYYACTSYVDSLVGQLIAELKKLKLEKNTIIVLWGDHGWHLGDHGLWCKHSNFEQAAKAPLIITAPGFKGNQKTACMTGFIDIYPTLCDLAKLKKPAHLQGVSLLPLMENPRNRVRKYVVSQYTRGKQKASENAKTTLRENMGYSLRTPRYRYTLWTKDYFNTNKKFDPKFIFAEELYDYERDPNETVNLANDPAFKKIRDEHYKHMTDFFNLSHKQQTVNK